MKDQMMQSCRQGEKANQTIRQTRYKAHRSSISKLGDPFFSSFHQISFSELGSLTTRLSRGLRPVLAPEVFDLMSAPSISFNF